MSDEIQKVNAADEFCTPAETAFRMIPARQGPVYVAPPIRRQR